MDRKARFIFIASMDVDEDKEELFNDIYDNEHIPLILNVPGVISAKRFCSAPLTMMIGGEKKTISADGEPHHSAVYELENADVLTSDAWAAAVDAGRWPTEVRPFTRNRRHALKKLNT